MQYTAKTNLVCFSMRLNSYTCMRYIANCINLRSYIVLDNYDSCMHIKGQLLFYFSHIVTELTPWSQWTCFNGTIALRNRTVQRCAEMEEIDPITNMTMTNTLCDNLIDIKRRTGNKLNNINHKLYASSTHAYIC